MATIDHARRQVTQQCEGCPTRRIDDRGGFRKEELAAILAELAPAMGNPKRMTKTGMYLSIANILGFTHAGERQFRVEEVEAIRDAIRERQQEVRARA